MSARQKRADFLLVVSSGIMLRKNSVVVPYLYEGNFIWPKSILIYPYPAFGQSKSNPIENLCDNKYLLPAAFCAAHIMESSGIRRIARPGICCFRFRRKWEDFHFVWHDGLARKRFVQNRISVCIQGVHLFAAQKDHFPLRISDHMRFQPVFRKKEIVCAGYVR